MKITGVKKWRVGIFEDDRRWLVRIANGIFTSNNFKYYRFKKNPVTAKHYHKFAEMFCVVEGKARFLLIEIDNPQNYDLIEIVEGDVLLVPQRVAHLVKAKENSLIFAVAEQPFISKQESSPAFDFSEYQNKIVGYGDDKMKVLITGGTGYLGTRTAIEIARAGHDVTILDVRPKPPGWEFYVPYNVKFYQSSVLDYPQLQEAANDVDVIVHMAFVVGGPSCKKNREYATRIALDGTTNITKVADGRRIIFTSSDAVYGNKATGKITEDFPCKPAEIYGQLKLNAEERIQKCSTYDILRLPTNFGVSPVMRYNLIVHYIIRELFRNKHVIIHQPEITRSIIEVGDAADAINFLLRKEPTNRVMNVLTTHLTKHQIAVEAAKIIGGDVEIDKGSSGDPDKRDFVLGIQKINQLGWLPTQSLASGVENLKRYLEAMSF